MRHFQQASVLVPRSAPGQRRGVLLVIVLSMLALFLLLGTAFLMTAGFYQDVATEGGKKDRTQNDRTDGTERALMQLVRGTTNPNSPLTGGESLLGDVYGTDGFEARVFIPPDDTQVGLMPQYAGATLASSPNELGSTGGQFIDIYVQDLDWRSMLINPAAVQAFPQPDARFVIKLHRDASGATIDHPLEPATGYHNGSLLTFTSGPANGQTARIVDYRYVGNATGAIAVDGTPQPVSNRPVWRIRIVAVARADGAPLALWGPANAARAREIRDLVEDPGTYLGVKFIVNGRPFNGTGPGFNPLAPTGTPRLNAVEVMQAASGDIIGAEIALLPNRRFVDLEQVGMYLGSGDPFSVAGATVNSFQSLNTPGASVTGVGLYTTPEGPGGNDESYDAVDYLNMFLARMPIYPQERASLIDGNGITYALDSNEGQQLIQSGNPMRCNFENMVIPSFHRPDLINFWHHRVLNSQWMNGVSSDESLRARAAMLPYGPNGKRGDADDPGIDLRIRDQLAALKRKTIMRPSIEDHPDFDGSNPASRYATTGRGGVALNGQIRLPAWEIVGPWDVDNDNDSIADSIWIDLGDTIRETEEGQLYKPLYAFLVVDMDGRLNLNAHGSIEHLTANLYDSVMFKSGGSVGNLVDGATSNLMPQGVGYGPGEISLRRIFSPNLPFTAPNLVGNPDYDDYARLFAGRPPIGPNDSTNQMGEAMFGRLGSAALTGEVRPGRMFIAQSVSPFAHFNRESLVPFENIGMPVTDPLRAARLAYNPSGSAFPAWRYMQPSAYGSAPDLKGKYSVGVDYTGQPVYESVWDYGTGNPLNPSTWTFVPLVDDSPYETDLSASGRRGPPRLDAVRVVGNVTPPDDAPFDISEMERLLRAHDQETGTAPSRLWEIVDTFDPQKYAAAFDGNPTNAVSISELALAEVMTAANRQQVTTDSYEIPTPSDVVPSYITELGPDGMPGNAGMDDDGNGETDDVIPFDPSTGIGEIGWYATQDPSNRSAGLYLTGWSDDFASLTGKSVSQARLVDVLWYRIQRNRIERGLPPLNFNNALAVAELNNITTQLLPPEVIAGYKMDLNRPFGDGRDNNGNGVVDEPIEAGEPYWDLNGDGVWQNGEPFIDLDGNGRYYGDTDGDGTLELAPGGQDLIPFDDNGDGTVDRYEIPFDSLWAEFYRGTAVSVDSVFGLDVSGPHFADTNGNGQRDANETVPLPNLRNDAHLARQLYARHLYVMMLMMMDEEYVAPYDPTDPQVMMYIRVKGKELLTANPGYTKEQAELLARRKYTYRQVAQWAVNCVDFRDSDATMTPFEYDENPWDGWGNIDTNGTPLDVSDDVYYPLDGDPATDENHRQYVNWEAMRDAVANNANANGRKIITPPYPTFGNNGNRLRETDCNRNVVWGAERPELLITETMAVHDMRLEDLKTINTHGDNTTFQDDTANNVPQDVDLDQRLRPRGSAFIELYNPWSPDAPGPTELYSQLERDNAGRIADVNGNGRIDVVATPGVELGRLSTLADRNGKRSPVWRVIVVEEGPLYRNPGGTDRAPRMLDVDDRNTHDVRRDLPDYVEVASQGAFKPTDVDWDEMLAREVEDGSGNDVRVTVQSWQQEHTTRPRPVEGMNPQDQPSSFTRRLFSKPYPYIEREFYFSSNDSFWAYRRQAGVLQETTNSLERTYTDLDFDLDSRITDEIIRNKLGVKIPFNYVKLKDVQRRSLTFRFLASPRLAQAGRTDVRIAPIMPGRYAVLGAAGVAYDAPEARLSTDSHNRPRFMTTMGRSFIGVRNDSQTEARTMPEQHLKMLQGTRRIELCPSPDPNQHQVLVGSNGGRPQGAIGTRYNELFVTEAGTRNVGDYDDNAGGDPDGEIEIESPVLAPTVAIPVENFNISEPVYGYEVRERELNELERDSGDEGQVWDPLEDGGEGGYVDDGGREAHYDTPFDEEPELREQGSVPNYRVIHLQRLADPSLPWNPPPGHNRWDQGQERPDQHDPSLPLNPYRTVDTATCDLTVFNGASSSLPPPQAPFNFFRSKERGANALAAVNTADAMPLREIWRQERASSETQWKKETFPSSASRTHVPENIRTREHIFENHYDFVMQHTLGFANASMGEIYLRQEVVPGTPAVRDPTDFDNDISTLGRATGAPRASGQVSSTYPWFTWNNRPFVSQNELLQVPSGSSANMLWYFSTINSATPAASQIDGYFGEEVRDSANMFLANPTATPPDDKNTNLARLRTNFSPFGHLLNMFQSSAKRSQILGGATATRVPVGAPNYHRLLDYVHVPSRFTQTKAMLNPVLFQRAAIVDPADPRRGLAAPFNFIPEYREPGKINLNTIVEQRTPAGGATAIPVVWSDVFDGLMHRVQDRDPPGGLGHFGPSLAHVVMSRRGYLDPLGGSGQNGTSLVMHPQSPTFFANPFRSPGAGDLVPLASMVQPGVEVSMLRSHPYRPGNGYFWGSNANDDGDLIVNETNEAGYGDDSTNLGARVPLFSELATTPAIDGKRNTAMNMMPLTRMGNLTTQRSGVFAVWVTVGYFEVKPAPAADWTGSGSDPQAVATAQKFVNQAGGDVQRAMRLYNKVYPQGYQLGKELGIETGEVERNRSFYIIDRTRPVGFKPGEDLNVENTILLRRRID